MTTMSQYGNAYAKRKSLRQHPQVRITKSNAQLFARDALQNQPVVITTAEDLRALELSHQTHLSLDLETTGLDFQRDDIVLIAIATNATESFVIDVTRIDACAVRDWVNEQLKDKLIIGQNVSFDIKFLARHYQYDVFSNDYYDTKLAEIILFAGLEVSNSLKDIVRRRLNVDLDKSVRLEFLDRGVSLTAKHYTYAALDALMTLIVREVQLIDLREQVLETVAELEMRLLPIVAGMEIRGVPFDAEAFRGFVSALETRRRDAEHWLQETLSPAAKMLAEEEASQGLLFPVPRIVNVNSKPVCRDGSWNLGQIWPVLDRAGITIVDKAGNPSLESGDIQRWDSTHQVDIAIPAEAQALVSSFRQYRNQLLNLYAYTISLQKLETTFVKQLKEMYRDGRLYYWLNQLGAKKTGRFSSNLQQLPKDEKVTSLGLPSLRSCIAAGEGYKLIIADFAGIELVILADMSGDSTLGDLIIRSARGEDDIHMYVVRQAFADLYPDAVNATPDKKKVFPYSVLRNAAKPTSYGIAYGITGIALSDTISHQLAPLGVTCTTQQAQRIIENWKRKAFRKAGAWLDKTSSLGQTRGYVTTALGRKRFFDLSVRDRKALAAIGREASNAPIQGTCADMLKLAMVYLDRDLDRNRAWIVLTVHDELVVHADADYAQEAAAIVKYAMESAAKKCLKTFGTYVVVEPAISDRYDK